MTNTAKVVAPGLVFEIPIDTQGGDNKRECWRARSQRQKMEKKAIGAICSSYRPTDRTTLRSMLRLMVVRGPLDVRLIRFYTGTRPCDSHNLGSRLKGVIDGLALVFGVDDGDTRIRYILDQERSKMPGIRVEISARKPVVQGPGWTAAAWRRVGDGLRDAAACRGEPGDPSRVSMERLAEQAEAMARALGGGG